MSAQMKGYRIRKTGARSRLSLNALYERIMLLSQMVIARKLNMNTLLHSIFATLLLLSVVSPAFAEAQLPIREGNSSYGRVFMTVTGNRVRLGDSSYGSVIFTIDGNKIREGDSMYGRVVATVDQDGRVREGDSAYGRVIATVDGNQVRAGDSSYGRTIANIEGGRMSGAAAASLLLLR